MPPEYGIEGTDGRSGLNRYRGPVEGKHAIVTVKP
jgi:hypothetical protein